MRRLVFFWAVLLSCAGLLAAHVFAALPAQAPKASSAAAEQKLPPLSYVCPMVQDAEVIEDKPGLCRKCKMQLVPIRLDSKFSCPIHPAIVRDGPGTCPLDKRELVRLTLSVYWTCGGETAKKLLNPGRCEDGHARKLQYEARAHGDHNPKHGGQFFMASDNWHHLEGTYPKAGLFRMHFYDDFTKPLTAKDFSGTIVVLDATDKEIASFPLTLARGGQTMEAQIKGATLPLKTAAKVKFDKGGPENRFDFTFTELSKEPPPAPIVKMDASAAASSSAQTGGRAAQTAGGTATQPAQGTVQTTTPSPTDTSQVPAALAAALDEASLPNSTADLLAELTRRAQEVESLLKEGSLAQVWLPAMSTKTVALALDSHAGALPERQRALATAAVKRVVTATWELDAYGDLGNKQKIADAYGRLASAIAALKAVYADAR